VLRKLHINIPFIDAIRQIPSYGKFLKDMISKKTKLPQYETVALTEEKLPPKLKDPGSFTLPDKLVLFMLYVILVLVLI